MNTRSTTRQLTRKRILRTRSNEYEENQENIVNIKRKKPHCPRSRKRVEKAVSSSRVNMPFQSVKTRSINKNKEIHDDEQSMICTDASKSSTFPHTSSNSNVVIVTQSSSLKSVLDKSKAEDNNGFQEEMQCAICLDTVESSDFQHIACDHIFHIVCIQTWFKVKEMCPICMGCSISDVYEDDSVYESLKESECKICMNTEVSSDFQFLECDHTFHTMCLQTWFQISESCPICMPTTSLNTSNIFEEIVYEECVICMGTEESSEFQFLSPCSHRFHSMCLQTWFEINESCPICMPLNFFEGQDLAEIRCMICMDIENYSEFESISCDPFHNIWHTFHSKCIEIWFQDNNSCPGCMPDTSINTSQTSTLNAPEEQDSEIIRCAICMDTDESTDFEFISCCHSFHSFCIQNWLKVKKKCPICNTIISVNGTTSIPVSCA